MRISDWSSDVCSSDLLVLGGVLLRVRVEDAALGLALAGEGHVVRRVGPVQQPRDDAVLTLVDRRRAGLPAHRAVNGLDGHLPGERGGVRLPRRDLTLARLPGGRRRVQGLARSEEHTSELQSLMRISYAFFCLNKTKNTT